MAITKEQSPIANHIAHAAEDFGLGGRKSGDLATVLEILGVSEKDPVPHQIILSLEMV